MPTLYVVVPIYGKQRCSYDFATQDAVVRELNAASLGRYTGTGGCDGILAFGYHVVNETAARDVLARAMAKHLPNGEYHVRVGPDSGCNIAFEILQEFTPRKLGLRRRQIEGFSRIIRCAGPQFGNLPWRGSPAWLSLAARA